MDKPAPQMSQTSQSNSVPPSNRQQQQLSEQWKDEGDADSGLEDGAQTDSLQGEQGGGKLPSTARTFLKKPVLKSVRYVAKQKSNLETEGPSGEAKVPGMSSGAKGQQLIVKKSIWDRLGGKVGETSGKQATVSGKVPMLPFDYLCTCSLDRFHTAGKV